MVPYTTKQLVCHICDGTGRILNPKVACYGKELAYPLSVIACPRCHGRGTPYEEMVPYTQSKYTYIGLGCLCIAIVL